MKKKKKVNQKKMTSWYTIKWRGDYNKMYRKEIKKSKYYNLKQYKNKKK